MNDKNRVVVSPGEKDIPTIQLRLEDGDCFPYHLELGVQEYNLKVTSDNKEHEKVIITELIGERAPLLTSKTNEEIGPFLLHDGMKYGIYIGDKEVSVFRRPDCVIEGNAKYILCPASCIKVCGGPCPPGYYYKGSCGTCSISLVLCCCCKVP